MHIQRNEIFAALVCAILGMLLSTLPHTLWLSRLGEPVYIADNDDLAYLAVSGHAYHNHPTYPSDFIHEEDGDIAYPALQFVPFVIVAKFSSVSPVLINLLWRLWAGFAFSIGLYLLLRFYTKNAVVAAVFAVILMSDIGLLYATLFLRHASVFTKLVTGHADALFTSYPQISLQWRVLAPSVILPLLLVHLWLLARARRIPTKLRIVLAGLGFGILFYVYFYFWTAAGLALLIAMCLEAKHWKTYFYTALIGGLIGLPSVVSNYFITRRNPSDWEQRGDFLLPISRFGELLIPKLAILLLVLSFVWIWKKRRDLIHLWSLAAAGLLLANHQILTGLQMQNFHWTYVWGTSISLLVVLFIAGEVFKQERPSRVRYGILVILACCFFTSAIWMRKAEALQTKQSVENTLAYQRYRTQRLSKQATQLLPNTVIAGDQSFVNLAVIMENVRPLNHNMANLTPSIDNVEWGMRVALNAFLLGGARQTFEQEQQEFFDVEMFGPWARSVTVRNDEITRRLAAFDAISVNPDEAIMKFGVRYIALASDHARPLYLVSDKWVQIEAGPYWQIWQRIG